MSSKSEILPNSPLCENNNCKQPVKFDYKRNRFRRFCSRGCSQNIAYVRDKQQLSPEQQEASNQKRIETCLKKYGTKYPQLNSVIKEKITNGIRKNLTEHPRTQKYKDNMSAATHGNKTENHKRNISLSQIGKIIDSKTRKKISITQMSQYALDSLSNKEFLIDKHIVQKLTLYEIAEELRVDDSTVGDYMRKHGIPIHRYTTSVAHNQIVEFLQKIGINDIIVNDRTEIFPYELDIYIPSYKLAIEYGGLYWHSERIVNTNYHLLKLESCEKNGIRLLTIFEDEWKLSETAIKKKLSHLCHKTTDRVFARKTNIAHINGKEKMEFFNNNHIQGDDKINYAYALVNEECVAIAMLSIKKHGADIEISRYATSKHVVGGFGKLLDYIIKTFNPDSIFTFADRRWSDGNLYEKTGFKKERTLKPDYRYIVGNQRIHKFNFRHVKLQTKLDSYDATKTERENMLQAGIYRIYDCGLIKYRLTLPTS